MYVFVSPKVFSDAVKCKAIVDKFCEKYKIENILAYNKVRSHDFKLDYDVTVSRALGPLHDFLHSEKGQGLPFSDIPSPTVAALLEKSSKDKLYLKHLKSNSDPSARIASIFDIVVLKKALDSGKVKSDREPIMRYLQELDAGKKHSLLAARDRTIESFSKYEELLLETAKQGME